jgi:hypothetical protein
MFVVPASRSASRSHHSRASPGSASPWPEHNASPPGMSPGTMAALGRTARLAPRHPAQEPECCAIQRRRRRAIPGYPGPRAGPDAGGGHRPGPGADPGRPRPAGRGRTPRPPHPRTGPPVRRGRVLPDPAAAPVRRLRVRPADVLAGHARCLGGRPGHRLGPDPGRAPRPGRGRLLLRGRPAGHLRPVGRLPLPAPPAAHGHRRARRRRLCCHRHLGLLLGHRPRHPLHGQRPGHRHHRPDRRGHPAGAGHGPGATGLCSG